MKTGKNKGTSVNARFNPALLALAGVLAALLFAASCSQQQANGDDEKSSPTGTPVSTKDWTKEKVELTYYYMSSDSTYEDFMEGYGNDIQKKYPNFTFKFLRNEKGTTLEDIIATKTKIDFFGYTASKITQLMDYGLVDDISDLTKKYKVDLNKLEPTSISAMTNITGGKVIGLPVKIISGTLFYNKDLFDKFGVPYLTDTMTWDQVGEAARKLTRLDGGTQYYGLGIKTDMLGVNSGPIPYVDPKTHHVLLSSDYWTKMFNRVLQLASIYSDTATRTMLTSSKMWTMFNQDMSVAIAQANNSAFPGVGVQWNMNWDIAQYPDIADMPNAGPQPSPYYYYISKNSPNREAAFLAISHLISEEVQHNLARKGRVPAIKDKSYLKVLGADQVNLQGKHVAGLVPKRYGEMAVPDDYTAAVTSARNAAFADVVAGKKDINTALRDATEAAEKKIAEMDAAK